MHDFTKNTICMEKHILYTRTANEAALQILLSLMQKLISYNFLINDSKLHFTACGLNLLHIFSLNLT